MRRRTVMAGAIGAMTSSRAVATLPPREPGNFLIFFDLGSSALSVQGRSTIVVAAREATQWPRLKVVVEGHSDVSETPDVDAALSRGRAEAVEAGLLEAGVPRARLRVEAYGSSKPVTFQNVDRATGNRRVQINYVEN